MSEISATCDGAEIKVSRVDVDGARISGVSGASKVHSHTGFLPLK